MKASLLKKAGCPQRSLRRTTALLGDAEVISDQTRFRAYSREYAEVEPVILAFRDYRKVQADLEGAQALLRTATGLRDLAEEEVAEARGRLAALGDSLQRMLLLPKDPNDSRNVFLEIRAGYRWRRGGDLLRRPVPHVFALRRAPGLAGRDAVGERGASTVATGSDCPGRGRQRLRQAQVRVRRAPRAQRVPETESQGRIHTSACTVAVLPEPDEQATIEINPADLRVDTYRSSGAGG